MTRFLKILGGAAYIFLLGLFVTHAFTENDVLGVPKIFFESFYYYSGKIVYLLAPIAVVLAALSIIYALGSSVPDSLKTSVKNVTHTAPAFKGFFNTLFKNFSVFIKKIYLYFKNSRPALIAGTILVVLVLLFYWFEYRRYVATKTCANTNVNRFWECMNLRGFSK